MERLSLSTIALLIIALIVFILVSITFFAPELGLTPKIAKTLLGVDKFLPLKPSPQIAYQSTVPESVTKSSNTLVESFKGVSGNAKKDCIIPFEGLNNLGDYEIESSESGGEVTFTIIEKQGKALLRHSGTSSKGKLCLADPTLFYECKLKDKASCPPNQKITSPITSRTFTKETIAPYLYINDEGNSCFIPVAQSWLFWCAYTKEGIRDSCVKNIPSKIPSC